MHRAAFQTVEPRFRPPVPESDARDLPPHPSPVGPGWFKAWGWCANLAHAGIRSLRSVWFRFGHSPQAECTEPPAALVYHLAALLFVCACVCVCERGWRPRRSRAFVGWPVLFLCFIIPIKFAYSDASPSDPGAHTTPALAPRKSHPPSPAQHPPRYSCSLL